MAIDTGLAVLSRCPVCGPLKRPPDVCPMCHGFAYLCDLCQHSLARHPSHCRNIRNLPTELQQPVRPFFPVSFYTRSWPGHDPPYLLITRHMEVRSKNTLDIFALTEIRAELRNED